MDARFISLADNASVATWSSRAGGLYGATAAGAAQPTFKARSVNGKPAVQFNGTGNVMDFDAGARGMSNGASGATAIVVGVVDSTAADAIQTAFHISNNVASAQVRFTLRLYLSASAQAAASGRRLDADSSIQTPLAVGATTSPGVFQANADWAGNALTVRTNGGTQTTLGYSSGAGNVSATNALSARLGAQDSATNRLSGRICAVFISATLINQPLRMRLRQALGFSFGIATA